MLEKSDTIKANARGFSVVLTITDCWHTKFRRVRYRRVKDWEASNGHTKDTTQLIHGPWHNAVGEHICAQPFRMWNRLRFHMFMQVSQIFQRRKSDANKQAFENKLNLTCQAQSTPKTVGILTKVFYIYGPNLVILAETGHDLSCRQACDWRTDGHTHRQMQATTIPEGQNWPRGKMFSKVFNFRDQSDQLFVYWNKEKNQIIPSYLGLDFFSST